MLRHDAVQQCCGEAGLAGHGGHSGSPSCIGQSARRDRYLVVAGTSNAGGNQASVDGDPTNTTAAGVRPAAR